jgi:hypothetical protein
VCHALRATVFDRLRDALDGCTRLFISPDGGLTRLPFGGAILVMLCPEHAAKKLC